jgi:hypothetical protein
MTQDSLASAKNVRPASTAFLGIDVSGAWVTSVLGSVLGLIFFALAFGWRGLNPLDVSWAMSGGDRSQHLLGWLFYRAEPWTYPLGMIRSFGAPTPTSIAYCDSIPVLAVVFKMFRGVLPGTFYYAGIWELTSYALQGALGALLIRALGGAMLAQGAAGRCSSF